MAIKANFNLDYIFEDLNRKLKPLVNQVVAEAFEMACLEVVKQAKLRDTYQDQTNHLRSSIGYQIYQNGELITEYFTADGKGDGTGATSGVDVGKNIAAQTARKYLQDTVGVVVAGADYALYVESKGYDVISGSASELADITRKYLKIAAQGMTNAQNNQPPQ